MNRKIVYLTINVLASEFLVKLIPSLNLYYIKMIGVSFKKPGGDQAAGCKRPSLA